MANCLLALGSNLGDRRRQLVDAVAAIDRLARTRIIAASELAATTPIGGPAGQDAFLNAAVQIQTGLPPRELLTELHAIEQSCGRQRRIRWDARTLDLDILLYGRHVLIDPAVTIPHPRMEYRGFVLRPAAEAAGWMVHAGNQWTVRALSEHLDAADNEAVVAGLDQVQVDAVVERLSKRFGLGGVESVTNRSAASPAPWKIGRWRDARHLDAKMRSAGRADLQSRPKLIIALVGGAHRVERSASDVANGGDCQRQWRRLMHLPDSGPIAWIETTDANRRLDEAAAAVQAVWPQAAIANS
ncbi:MAG: 2-amino-4-hydroxy-6-hydroxymethyldihydropteridine diphosphokinase [Planctomycetota bacterium]